MRYGHLRSQERQLRRVKRRARAVQRAELDCEICRRDGRHKRGDITERAV